MKLSIPALPALILLIGAAGIAPANPPVASYIFPPGGQCGKAVEFHVGGLFLNKTCSFDMYGPGVEAGKQLQRTRTLWFEGPMLPLPESQQAEDYPQDMAGRVRIAGDAPLGARYWRVATSQGTTPAMKFVVGDLPEIVEREIDGDPVPVDVQLPVTINGRIFPRENVDMWSIEARTGQSVTCEVNAARLGSPLDSHLEVYDPLGRKIAENDDYYGADSFLRFTAAVGGKYQVRIHDINHRGGQAYVYRLTLTSDPRVERAYPLGGKRGTHGKFELTGQGVPAGPVEIAIPSDAPADFAYRLPVGDRLTNACLLDVDDLPEYQEMEPNDEPAQVKPLAVPAVLNGRIGKPGDVDYWAITAVKGAGYEIDLRASRLGSPLSGILSVQDAAGKELGRSDSLAGKAEAFIRFTAPAEGTYYVRIQERFQARGGPEYAYRIRIDHPATTPGFHLHLAADALTINRGGTGKLKVLADRLGGFSDPIPLIIEGLPAGITATGTTIAAKQAAGEITFKVDSAAAILASRLVVRGSAKFGNDMVTRTAMLPSARGTPELDHVLLAVTLPTPFKIKGDHDFRWASQGTVHHRHYQIERGGFEGPIEVSLADRQARHLQGVTGPRITVPPGASEFDYRVHLPPWIEIGRTSRTCVMGTAVIKDTDGTEHVVTASSVQPDDQIIVVVEPGKLAVEADRGSLIARPGQKVTIQVRVARGKSLTGPEGTSAGNAQRQGHAGTQEVPGEKHRQHNDMMGHEGHAGEGDGQLQRHECLQPAENKPAPVVFLHQGMRHRQKEAHRHEPGRGVSAELLHLAADHLWGADRSEPVAQHPEIEDKDPGADDNPKPHRRHKTVKLGPAGPEVA